MVIRINGVANPDKAGGTGNFIIKTMQGINIIDQTLIVRGLGIAGAVN